LLVHDVRLSKKEVVRRDADRAVGADDFNLGAHCALANPRYPADILPRRG
jgi:hypothetical protein